MSSFDTEDQLLGKADALVAAGITSVGVYARTDRCPWNQVQELQAAGIKMFSIYEKGNPTQDSYFTARQASSDAQEFLAWASTVGQPKGTPVFACADYDSNPVAIAEYVIAFHDAIKPEGYLFGLYGNGASCQHFKMTGYLHFTFLSQSKGFSGYDEWLTQADIVQGPSQTFLGLNVDQDTVRNPAVLW